VTITLVLTAHDRDDYLATAVEIGAAGFITKKESPQKIVKAIRRVARGEILFTKKQLTRANWWREEIGKRWEGLTKREREVLALIIDGQSSQQVAEALVISECTVRTHIGNILSKLGVASRAELIAWAWQHSIVEKAGYSG